MSPAVDIRPLKQRLRKEIKNWRKGLPPLEKAQMDSRISRRITGLREYASCQTILTYVSTPIEVDTLQLIQRAWAAGKQVAVPRCIEGSRYMDFYFIHSLEDLAPRTFGVLEPVPERCRKLTDFKRCLCIVPALAYDREGFRLGYGAGYYDRFLSRFPGPKIGIVYAANMRFQLWHGQYDIPVDLIVTEKRLYVCQKSTKQGG